MYKKFTNLLLNHFYGTANRAFFVFASAGFAVVVSKINGDIQPLSNILISWQVPQSAIWN